MTVTTGTFKHARRPEQVQQRRESILAAARLLLRTRRVTEVTLRELGAEVGLAMSNVLHYFDSRDAIFLEILDEAWRTWLDSLEPAMLAAVRRQRIAGPTRARSTATTLTGSLVERPLFCELLSAQASVLERNISPDYARDFKQRAFAHHERLTRQLRAALPTLDVPASSHSARMVVTLTAGLWLHAHPTPAVAAVVADLGQRPPMESFPVMLHRALEYQLIGATSA